MVKDFCDYLIMRFNSIVKFLILLAIVAVLPVAVFAKVGVGVGAGKIRLSEELRAGGIYDLPAVPVLNTGDEPADYQFSVQYHEGQETRSDMGLKPAKEWFTFTPQSFSLEPGKVQTVKVMLTLPTKVTPGNYFAYLEAQPIKKKSVAGETSIGIAAATQLWFTVAPANFFQGIYYRFISLYTRYYPWDTVVLAVIFFLVLLWYISKKFKFQIARK